MKSVIVLALGLLSASAFACPDISGIYTSAEGLHLKFVQKGCTDLQRFLGEVADDGTVTFPDVAMDFPLDGKPSCGIRSFCTTATATPDALRFETNYDASVTTDTHGRCSDRGYTLSLDAHGNLIGTFAVFNCTDKFTGGAVKTFQKN